MSSTERLERIEGEAREATHSVSLSSTAQQAFIVALIIVIFLAAWEGLARAQNIQPFLLPKPTEIAQRFLRALNDGTLSRHVGVTWSEALIAFSFAFLFSSALGYTLAKSPLLEKIVSPFIIASQSLPIFALAPFVLIILGSGFWSNALMGALVAFFPMLVNTISALRNIQPEQRDVMRSFAASPLQVFFMLEVPATLPSIFSSIRVGITLAVIGVLVVELFWADRGIGFLLNFAKGQFDTPLLFAGIVALVIMNLTMYVVVAFLQRVLMPWQHSATQN